MCTLSSSSSSVDTLRISAQSFNKSSFEVCVDVTVKLVETKEEKPNFWNIRVTRIPKQKKQINKLSYRITYFPFNEAGTQCMWPRWFKRLSKRSVKSFSPLIRNTTIPVASHRTAIEPHHKYHKNHKISTQLNKWTYRDSINTSFWFEFSSEKKRKVEFKCTHNARSSTECLSLFAIFLLFK